MGGLREGEMAGGGGVRKRERRTNGYQAMLLVLGTGDPHEHHGQDEQQLAEGDAVLAEGLAVGEDADDVGARAVGVLEQRLQRPVHVVDVPAEHREGGGAVILGKEC